MKIFTNVCEENICELKLNFNPCDRRFIADGDTKIVGAIENTYPELKVSTLKCIGHVQKRRIAVIALEIFLKKT